MFQIGNTLLSDDVATARFACNLTACKGACCVIGTSGAPVKKSEIPILNLAYKALKSTLRPESQKAVDQNELILESGNGYELQCAEDGSCVFVVYDEHQIARCAIQKAFLESHFSWVKPISCHLFPLRITTIGPYDYVNFEFVPEICSPAPDHARSLGIYLYEYLQEPLTRLYGISWYDTFQTTCAERRVNPVL